MYFLNNFCCICLSDNKDLFYLSDLDSDEISYFAKLKASIPEMNFMEVNSKNQICKKCCIALNTVHNFRERCLKSISILKEYISKLPKASNVSDKINVYLSDIKRQTQNISEINVSINVQCIKKECETEENFQENFTGVNNIQDENDETCDNLTENQLKDIEMDDIDIKTEYDYYKPCDYLETSFDSSLENDPLEIDIKAENWKKEDEEFTSGIYNCNICQNEFTEETLLKMHMYSTHTEKNEPKKVYSCKICSKKFHQPTHLKVHMQIHSSEKPLECNICNKKFNYPHSLAYHTTVHTGKNPYECNVCKKSFNGPNNLNLHMKYHLLEKPHECSICYRRFYHLKSLHYHMQTHAEEITVRKSARVRFCGSCNKVFSHPINVDEHVRVHTDEEPFECSVCKRKNKLKNTLKKHMRIHKALKRIRQCEMLNSFKTW